jgi:hypothetical protein
MPMSNHGRYAGRNGKGRGKEGAEEIVDKESAADVLCTLSASTWDGRHGVPRLTRSQPQTEKFPQVITHNQSKYGPGYSSDNAASDGPSKDSYPYYIILSCGFDKTTNKKVVRCLLLASVRCYK